MGASDNPGVHETTSGRHPSLVVRGTWHEGMDSECLMALARFLLRDGFDPPSLNNGGQRYKAGD